MSRSSTGRGVNAPLGRDTAVVRSANTMTSRVLLLYWLAHARGCFVILEQPHSSLMFLHPRFQQLIARVPIFNTKLFLGHYLAESAKLIMLYCNHPEVANLHHYRLRRWLPTSSGVCTYVKDEFGIVKVSGSYGLKNTQSYPLGFGYIVARVYDSAVGVLRDRLRAREFSAGTSCVDWVWLWSPLDDDWGDAALQEPASVLRELALARGVRF
jgi:hypothetical protein